jgi:hypothetical protein
MRVIWRAPHEKLIQHRTDSIEIRDSTALT